MDEWLLETVEMPVLAGLSMVRASGAASGILARWREAMAAFPGVRWVRRWTGGGTVDHRADWTYTRGGSAGEALAGLRGAESYRMIHAALAAALVAEGLDARLSTGADATGVALCFENPVSHDLMDRGGRKLAGAGQRRTRRGLLHQGSVAVPCDPELSRGPRTAPGFLFGDPLAPGRL